MPKGKHLTATIPSDIADELNKFDIERNQRKVALVKSMLQKLEQRILTAKTKEERDKVSRSVDKLTIVASASLL